MADISHVIEQYPGWQGGAYQNLVDRLLGGLFVYTDASTVTLEVVGIDQWMYFSVSDGQDLIQIVRMFSDLTCNLAVSGAGGLHNAYAEAIDTPYVIYAAWDPSTEPDEDAVTNPADLVLFAVPSGTVVNAALVAALTGGGTYSWWSCPLGVMINDGASDILTFVMSADGWMSIPPTQVETAGVAIAWTAVDCSDVVPDLPGIGVQFRIMAESTGVADRNVAIGLFDGTNENTILTLDSLANIAGSVKRKTALLEVWMIDTPTTFFVFDWDVAPSYGLDVYVTAIKVR